MQKKDLEVIEIPCEIIDMNHTISEKKATQINKKEISSLLSGLHIFIKNRFHTHKKFKKTF